MVTNLLRNFTVGLLLLHAREIIRPYHSRLIPGMFNIHLNQAPSALIGAPEFRNI